MSFTVGLSMGVAVGIVFGALATLARTPRPRPPTTPAAPARDGEPAPHPDDPYRGRPMSELLTGPPIVETIFGDKTLGEYLKHHPSRDGVWHGVVATFYSRAAADVRIAPYFAGVDVGELQKHFMAAVMLVTGEGLRVGTVRSMENRHAHVRNLDGDPITAEVYDRTVGIFAGVIADELRRDGVDPAPVIAQLVATIAPLRNAIATA